jgi:hypothetical protein
MIHRCLLPCVLLLAGPVIASPAAQLSALAPGLAPQAIDEAPAAIDCARTSGIGDEASRLAIIDYTRPSREPRLWVFDLARGELLFHEHVAHGRQSGEDLATAFSNSPGSHQTSLGLFLTDDTYQGGNGYSMRMHGLSGSLNDAAFERLIVMHGANYVDPIAAMRRGRLGRSWGCPAVRPHVARPLIDALRDGHFLYAYGPGSAAAKDCRALAHGRPAPIHGGIATSP